MPRFAVIDVETTGLQPECGHRIVEIAVIVLDDQFQVVRLLETLVNPLRRIPAEVTRIHGLRDADVQTASPFSQIVPDLFDCLAGVTHLVGHNLKFDLGFLSAEFRTCGIELPAKRGEVCTMKIARKLAIASDAKLQTVASSLGVPFPAVAHRAAVDAGVTARILPQLLEHSPSSLKKSKPINWPTAGHPLCHLKPRKAQPTGFGVLADLGLRFRGMLHE